MSLAGTTRSLQRLLWKRTRTSLKCRRFAVRKPMRTLKLHSAAVVVDAAADRAASAKRVLARKPLVVKRGMLALHRAASVLSCPKWKSGPMKNCSNRSNRLSAGLNRRRSRARLKAPKMWCLNAARLDVVAAGAAEIASKKVLRKCAVLASRPKPTLRANRVRLVNHELLASSRDVSRESHVKGVKPANPDRLVNLAWSTKRERSLRNGRVANRVSARLALQKHRAAS